MNNLFNSQTIFIRKIVECRIARDGSATLKNLVTGREVRTKVVRMAPPSGRMNDCYAPAMGAQLTFADDISVALRV